MEDQNSKAHCFGLGSSRTICGRQWVDAYAYRGIMVIILCPYGICYMLTQTLLCNELERRCFSFVFRPMTAVSKLTWCDNVNRLVLRVTNHRCLIVRVLPAYLMPVSQAVKQIFCNFVIHKYNILFATDKSLNKVNNQTDK